MALVTAFTKRVSRRKRVPGYKQVYKIPASPIAIVDADNNIYVCVLQQGVDITIPSGALPGAAAAYSVPATAAAIKFQGPVDITETPSTEIIKFTYNDEGGTPKITTYTFIKYEQL